MKRHIYTCLHKYTFTKKKQYKYASKISEVNIAFIITHKEIM